MTNSEQRSIWQMAKVDSTTMADDDSAANVVGWRDKPRERDYLIKWVLMFFGGTFVQKRKNVPFNS